MQRYVYCGLLLSRTFIDMVVRCLCVACDDVTGGLLWIRVVTFFLFVNLTRSHALVGGCFCVILVFHS